jgi:uncharacterized protein (DUF433 family)
VLGFALLPESMFPNRSNYGIINIISPHSSIFRTPLTGGKPCIRGMRVTVGMIVGLVASGYNKKEILEIYPYLQREDIDEALRYAAWRVEEIELPLWTGTA